MNKLGEKIAAIRKSKGFSQEKLAEDANINLRTLQRIEKGQTRPHGETLKRICQVLELPIEEVADKPSFGIMAYINLLVYILVIVLAGILVYSQLEHSGSSSSKLIVKRIQYDVPIWSGDLEIGWGFNNINKPEREEFIRDLFDKALSGQIKTCDIYFNPIGPEQLKVLLTDSFHMVLMNPVPPYSEFDTCILRLQNPEEIDVLRFQEEWMYNEENLVIQKRVLGVCPFINVNSRHRIVNRPLFWVYYDDLVLQGY
jgi:transcriptional regulator with XRE-family HTH domain